MKGHVRKTGDNKLYIYRSDLGNEIRVHNPTNINPPGAVQVEGIRYIITNFFNAIEINISSSNATHKFGFIPKEKQEYFVEVKSKQLKSKNIRGRELKEAKNRFKNQLKTRLMLIDL